MLEAKTVTVTNPFMHCMKGSLYSCYRGTKSPSHQVNTFSALSLLLSKFRNQIDPDLAGRMVFIKKNFEWYEEFLQKASRED
jgi:hypothetical protein